MDAIKSLGAEFLLDSFSSGEESDDEMQCSMLELVALQFHRRKKNRVPLYVENTVPRYVDVEFRRLFRLSQEAAGRLNEKFEASLFYPQATHGRPRMSSEKTVLIALTYLTTQTSMVQIADKFDVAESSVQNSLNRVLLFSMSEQVITWPNEEERRRSHKRFEEEGNKEGWPDCLKALVALTDVTSKSQGHRNWSSPTTKGKCSIR
ncbi:hypothetical protein V5799_011877 [Amblyomma americanum]|uniref:Nuclease harbi1-like protein n=1 Tax=Amblyomma americanum TaxID=6943 RepID=A0AAQ4EFM8_AMBAM